MVLVLLVPLGACNGANDIQRLKSLWQDVVTAESVERERASVSQVEEYLSGRSDIFLELRAVDPSDKEVRLDEVSSGRDVRIEIRFTSGKSSFDSAPRTPREPANVFLLLQE